MVATKQDFEAIDVDEKALEDLDNSLEDEDDGETDTEEEPENVESEEEGDEDEDDEDEDEEDPEDPQETLKEKCGEMANCAALKELFDECEMKVTSRKATEENCAQELLDFVGCVDKCVSKSLFSHLK